MSATHEFLKSDVMFTPATRDSEALLRSADRILAALGEGKQSPKYKRVKAVLDKLIGEVQR